MSERRIYCSLCCHELPVEMFRQDRVKEGTKRDQCKSCRCKKAREWNLRHPERHRSNKEKYHSTDKAIATSKLWRTKHSVQLSQYVREWTRKNPEKWKAICRRTRQKNIDKILVRNREREILEFTVTPKWADKEKIRAIYAEAKRLTRETGVKHHVDHIIPIRGKNVCGLHVETNLQILTAIENIKKGNRVPEVFA